MRKTWWLLLLILIIATFLRTYHLKTTPPGLYPDEAMNGSNALEALRTHEFKVFYPENNGREGLFMNVQALFMKWTGTREPWTLRFPAAIFGILTVLGTFFFARELFRRDDIGLLASFLLATSFWHINFSRIGFRAITASFFLVWALYFFLKAVRSRPAAAYLNAAIGGIFFGLGFYSYISYRAMPLLFLAFIPFFRKSAGFYKKTAVFIVLTFIIAAPIGWYFLKHPADFFGRTTQVAVTASSHPLRDLGANIVKTIGMLDFRGDGNWRHNYANRPELFFPVGILFWIGVMIGLYELKRGGGRFEYLILFGWLILAMLPVVVSDEGIPHALRSILMLVPLMTIAAGGGIWLWERTSRALTPASRKMILSLFFALLFLEAWHTYFILWAKNPNVAGAFSADYVAIARDIRSLPQDEPKYVLIEAGGGTVRQTDPFSGEVHEIPIPAQTVMYLTDSFSPVRQKERNIHYVLPGERASIPGNAKVFTIK
jgi:hypothetical protein